MKYIILILVVLSYTLNAKFSLTGVNSEEFPKIKMGFSATDNSDNAITDIVPSDFTIVENGVDLSATLELICEDLGDLREASILLVLDQSRSMRPSLDDPTDRWEWVVEGATNFIDAVSFEGRTQVGISIFGKTTRLLHPFTQDRNSLVKAVEEHNPAGTATFYNPPFLDPEVGAVNLLSEMPTDVRRIVVFLTDGLNTDNEDDRYLEITDELNNNGINAYTITLLMPMPTKLGQLATDTGGRDYEVFTRENLSEIYQLIALDIQKVQSCNLYYTSPFGCDENSRDRTLTVDFSKDTEKKQRIRNYFAPENSVAKFDFSKSLVNFGNPDPNNSTISSVTFSNVTAPLKIDDLSISPNNYFKVLDFQIDGVDASFGDTAPIGSSISVNMEFTQGPTKEFRQASLNVVGDFCGPNIELVGGFSEVVLISPNDGIVSSACEDILIEWAGVDISTSVSLYYEFNADGNWIPLNGGAPVSGGSFIWTAPNAGEYKFRVVRDEQQLYLWNYLISSNEDAITAGITLDDNGTFIYNTGYFENSVNIKNEDLPSTDFHDIYYSKVDRDGNLEWNFRITGPGDDSTSGISKLPNGDILICGTVEKGANFGPVFPNMEYNSKSYAFVAQISPDGTILNVRTFGSKGVNNETEAWFTGIRYDAGRIEIVGRYRGILNIPMIPFPKDLPHNGGPNSSPFVVYLNDDFSIINGYEQGYNLNDFESFLIDDGQGNEYGTAFFIDSDNPFSYQSSGKYDSYVYKFGTIEESVDENEVPITVEKPILVFNQTIADAGDVMISDFGTFRVEGVLTNPGDLAVEIESFDFDNFVQDEFTLNSLIPNQILAGETINIEFIFTPQELGKRDATFNIKGICTDIVSIDLTGNGTCRGEADESFDVGAAVTQVPKNITANSIFRNPTNQSLFIEPIIINDLTNQFEVFINDNGNRVNSISVPPFQSVDIDIIFTPNSEGIQTATIDFQVIDVCENVTTDIFGEGINSSVVATATPITNRVFTVNSNQIELENLSPLAVEITEVSLVDNNEGYFELLNIQNNYNLDANSKILIDYTFHPLTEGDFTSKLRIVTSDGKVNESTLLVGRGLEPNLIITFNCPETTLQGEVGNAELILENTSQFEEVKAINVTSLINEYKFDGDLTDLTEFELAPNSTRTINVNFAPINNNDVAAQFDITADAALGNNIDDTYESELEYFMDFDPCVVEQSINTDNIDFGNILVCEKPGEEIITIENTSSSNLIINSDDLVFKNQTLEFFIDNSFTGLDLAPGSTGSIKVIFEPSEEKLYNEILTINNNQGKVIEYSLEGNGVHINLDLKIEKNNLKPNQSTEFDEITISATIPEIANGKPEWFINNLKIRLSYNNNLISILETLNSLTSPDFNWVIDNQNSDYIELNGSGILQAPLNQDIIKLTYTVYLSDVVESDINYKIIYDNCSTPDFEPETVNIAEFCAYKYRLVNSDIIPFNIKGPNPNPINSNTSIDFSIPHNSNTKIEIYDMLGNLISTQFDGYTQRGNHSNRIDVSSIPNGVYVLKVSTMLNSETKQIIISK
ncbi:choice-of-anchor D domain-containing protein [Candidatus Kapabacteria bacterium]|nr:choice-of-anchor D domain-containing protein [Candidatus Kapabacteria bacterium]